MRKKLVRSMGKCVVLMVCLSMILVVPGTVFAKKLTLRFAHSESTTNIRHATVIGRLLRGEFGYDSQGILDRDHLRFFTFNSIVKLFIEEIGLKSPLGPSL